MDAFLERERAKYAAQMERYALASGEDEVRLALWYPMVGRLIWWTAVPRSDQDSGRGIEQRDEAQTGR